MRRNTAQIKCTESDLSAANRHNSRYRPQEGGFPSSVRANQGDDLPFVNFQRNTLQRKDTAVGNLQVPDREQCAICAHPATSSPRYASITRGWLWISFGVPSAMVSPKSSTLIRSAMPMTTRI